MNVIKTLALAAVIAMLAACNKASEEAAAPAVEEVPAVEAAAPMEAAPAADAAAPAADAAAPAADAAAPAAAQ
jgi:hypothetical protein